MIDLSAKAETLAQKIKHLIITTSGHSITTATIEEFYYAFCLSLREEIMVNTAATIQTIREKKPRVLNFLSMEYLPGRFVGNNISNLSASELIKATLKNLDRNFSEILACETDPGLGNGGLGRLSACFLDSLATLNYPARGYGLRYQYGIFEQEIWDGVQVERPDCWLLNANPWEARRDLFAANVYFGGRPIHATNRHGEDVYHLEHFEEVRAIPFDFPVLGYSKKKNYSAPLLRLWSTKESPRNFSLQRFNAGLLDQASENTCLTDVLYPNDNNELGKRVRLKQEFLLVSASLQDILRRHLKSFGDLSQLGDKVRIQINDTHPALIIAELVRVLTKSHDFCWKDAWEVAQACCSYTNHTILKEALEEWNEHRVYELLPRQHQIIQKLNLQFCNYIREKYHGDEDKVRKLSFIENGQIRMAHLAVFGSHKINGVAKLHSEILKEKVFKDFYELYPEKFTNVTNGVTQRRWLAYANPRLSEFLSKRIGDAWITDFQQIEKIKAFAGDEAAQKEFLAIKKENKKDLLHFLNTEHATRDRFGKAISHTPVLTENALFDVQIKRIHEYKRQLLNALHLIMLYFEPKKRAISRMSIIAGKAAPGYDTAKHIIQLLSAISRKFKEDFSSCDCLCVAFLENYNVSLAEKIIPAADLSEQISTAGWEASGTGNMKLSMNGALTIGTEDGANIEMKEKVTEEWWPFCFGANAEENHLPYHPKEIYEKDPEILRALESLKDGTFAKNESEEQSFSNLYQNLVGIDHFRVLKDLRPYYEAQKKVEELFLTPNKWAEMAIHNIGSMGSFSTDVSIQTYAKEIWGLEPCPIDEEILKKVREEYSAHDRCYIAPKKS